MLVAVLHGAYRRLWGSSSAGGGDGSLGSSSLAMPPLPLSDASVRYCPNQHRMEFLPKTRGGEPSASVVTVAAVGSSGINGSGSSGHHRSSNSSPSTSKSGTLRKDRTTAPDTYTCAMCSKHRSYRTDGGYRCRECLPVGWNCCLSCWGPVRSGKLTGKAAKYKDVAMAVPRPSGRTELGRLISNAAPPVMTRRRVLTNHEPEKKHMDSDTPSPITPPLHSSHMSRSSSSTSSTSSSSSSSTKARNPASSSSSSSLSHPLPPPSPMPSPPPSPLSSIDDDDDIAGGGGGGSSSNGTESPHTNLSTTRARTTSSSPRVRTGVTPPPSPPSLPFAKFGWNSVTRSGSSISSSGGVGGGGGDSAFISHVTMDEWEVEAREVTQREIDALVGMHAVEIGALQQQRETRVFMRRVYTILAVAFAIFVFYSSPMGVLLTLPLIGIVAADWEWHAHETKFYYFVTEMALAHGIMYLTTPQFNAHWVLVIPTVMVVIRHQTRWLFASHIIGVVLIISSLLLCYAFGFNVQFHTLTLIVLNFHHGPFSLLAILYAILLLYLSVGIAALIVDHIHILTEAWLYTFVTSEHMLDTFIRPDERRRLRRRLHSQMRYAFFFDYLSLFLATTSWIYCLAVPIVFRWAGWAWPAVTAASASRTASTPSDASVPRESDVVGVRSGGVTLPESAYIYGLTVVSSLLVGFILAPFVSRSFRLFRDRQSLLILEASAVFSLLVAFCSHDPPFLSARFWFTSIATFLFCGHLYVKLIDPVWRRRVLAVAAVLVVILAALVGLSIFSLQPRLNNDSARNTDGVSAATLETVQSIVDTHLHAHPDLPPADPVVTGTKFSMAGEPGRQRPSSQSPSPMPPLAPYPLCRADWHGLDLVDLALFAELPYFPGNSTRFHEYFTPASTTATASSASGSGSRGDDSSGGGWRRIARLQHYRATTDNDDAHDGSIRSGSGGSTPVVPAYFEEFYHAGRNISVISIRGTDPTSYDLVQDLAMFMDVALVELFQRIIPFGTLFVPDRVVSGLVQISSFLDLVYDVKKFYFDLILDALAQRPPLATASRTVLVGHSLGGGVAAIVGARLGWPSVGFSPPGIDLASGKYSIPRPGTGTGTGDSAAAGSSASSSSNGYGYAAHDNRFALSTIIIPEDDFVPLVDRHRAAIQHIPCRAGLGLPCHAIDHTICQLVRSCGSGRSVSESSHGGGGAADSSRVDHSRERRIAALHRLCSKYRPLYGSM